MSHKPVHVVRVITAGKLGGFVNFVGDLKEGTPVRKHQKPDSPSSVLTGK